MCVSVYIQAVIQLVYLLFIAAGDGPVSNVVLASMLFSFVTLTASIAGDDAKMFEYGFSGKDVLGDSTRRRFMALYAFRVLEVVSKMVLMAYVWFAVHGAALIGFVGIDLIIGIVLYSKYRQFSLCLLSVLLKQTKFFCLKTHSETERTVFSR